MEQSPGGPWGRKDKHKSDEAWAAGYGGPRTPGASGLPELGSWGMGGKGDRRPPGPEAGRADRCTLTNVEGAQWGM